MEDAMSITTQKRTLEMLRGLGAIDEEMLAMKSISSFVSWGNGNQPGRELVTVCDPIQLGVVNASVVPLSEESFRQMTREGIISKDTVKNVSIEKYVFTSADGKDTPMVRLIRIPEKSADVDQFFAVPAEDKVIDEPVSDDNPFATGATEVNQ
jgi:hypothetical protein